MPRSSRSTRGTTPSPATFVLITTLVASTLAFGLTVQPSSAEAAPADATALEPVAPCRLYDSREAGGRVPRRGSVVLTVAGRCGVPSDAEAVALSIVVTGATHRGFATAFPAGGRRPVASNLNFQPRTTVANSAIVPLANGRVEVYLHEAAHVIVDVTAAFRPVDGPVAAGRFRPVTPRRLLDTRLTGQRGAGSLRVPLPSGVPADASALVVNVTIVDAAKPGFVAVRPAGTARDQTSVQNADQFNRTRAVTVIAAASGRGIDVYRHVASDVVVDLAGWFTGPSAATSEDGLFVPRAPTRLYDSRQTNVPLHRRGAIEVPIDGIAASAVVANVTAVETVAPGFVSAYPAGRSRPNVSLQNPRWRSPLANMAVVAASPRGITLYGHEGMHVLVDLMGHFTGPRASGGDAKPANTLPSQGGNVLLVADSAFAGIRWSGNLGWLRGATFRADLESCRRLSGVSCRGREGYTPTTAATAIRNAPGSYDTLVVAAGYDDFASLFDEGVAAVLAAARARGIPRIVWVTYLEDVNYSAPYGAANAAAYRSHNAYLRWLVTSGLAPEVELADWNAYTANAPSTWLTWDGIHLTAQGSQAAAAYISQKLAYLERRACPPGIGRAAPGGWCADPDRG